MYIYTFLLLSFLLNVVAQNNGIGNRIPIILNSKSKNTLEYQKTVPAFLNECGPTEQEVVNPHSIDRSGAKTKFECMASANEILIRESFLNVATNTPGACMRIVGCTYEENDADRVCKDGTIIVWNAVKKTVVHESSNRITKEMLKKEDIDSNNFKFMTTENKGRVAVINTDPGCIIHTTDDYVRIAHRFLNQVEKIRKDILNSDKLNETGNFEVTHGDLYQKPISQYGQLLYDSGTISLGKPIHNGNYVTQGSKVCNTQCFWGQTITYDNIAKNSEFHASIYLKGNCEWMKVCFDTLDRNGAKKCDDVNLLNIYLQNDFAVMPGRSVGIPMQFFKGRNQAFTVVHIQYTKQNRVILTTAFRERTVSVPLNHHAIAFFFSHQDCLEVPFGIVGMAGDGNVHALDNSQQSELESPNSLVNSAAPINEEKNDAGLDVDVTTSARPYTFTPDPEVFVPATTTPVKVLVHGRVAYTGGQNDSTASQNRVSGWSTWAVFGGFATGSVSAFTIAGFILYICRRSFYTEWYRGMYQRYGCDASGVTGGTTGSQFGNTTTGASQMGTTLNNTSNMGTITVNTTDGTSFGGTTADGNTAGISAGDMVTM